MWIRHNIEQLQLHGMTTLTIGAFDGVHLGHQALIRATVAGAQASCAPATVLTFEPLPRQVLGNSTAGLLSSLEERLSMFEALGADGTLVLPFTPELAETSADDFVRLLVEQIHLAHLWIGPDFALGKHQEGDARFLQAASTRYGFQLHVLDQAVVWRGKPVRSSRIRQALVQGNLEEANGCLGRPYPLIGEVGHGDQRGRVLGFPTANLLLPEQKLLPANGVYVCSAILGRGTFAALVNVGTRPTFDHSHRTVEAYLLDFSADVYGEQLRLDFLHRLRPELRFPSAETLIAQMRQDELDGRAWLRTWQKPHQAS